VKASTFLAAIIAVGTAVCTANAAQVRIDGVGATSQGYVFVDYSVDKPFEDKSLEAIRSGLPSTLTYTIEVWRQRPGWWDKLEEAREVQFRVLRDLLNDQYVLASREDVRRFPTLDSLATAACAHRREYLRPLAPDKPYYVVVSLNLAPLSVDDLRELEIWLQGTIRTGEGERGGITGLSGTMVGMLLSATGFGDQTFRGRSSTFVPQVLPRIQGAEPRPVAGSVRDSSATRHAP
jgi:hypothetical protein